MFYSYRIVFKIEKTNYFNYIKWVSIIILLILGVTNVIFIMKDFIFFSWQVTMALALQLILYQKELKTLFKAKNQ